MSHATEIETSTKIPQHVAIIMDGNGRWAKKRGLIRTEGHKAGAERIREIVQKCLELGIRYLTLYAFSKENWKRPKNEVNSIMRLSERFFYREFDRLKREGVYIVHLGDRKGLPSRLLKLLDRIEANNTQEQRIYLNIAFNYSGRSELVEAFKKMAHKMDEGEFDPSEITEDAIQRFLYTKGIPDPDLLIRTGGEQRVSNFLLWQIAYTELWVTDILWPDFTAEVFMNAIHDYSGRKRRFGGI